MHSVGLAFCLAMRAMGPVVVDEQQDVQFSVQIAPTRAGFPFPVRAKLINKGSSKVSVQRIDALVVNLEFIWDVTITIFVNVGLDGGRPLGGVRGLADVRVRDRNWGSWRRRSLAHVRKHHAHAAASLVRDST